MAMVDKMGIIPTAIGEVFSDKKHIILSFIAAAFIFSFLVLAPVGRLSEKAFYYQLISIDKESVIIMVFFSMLAGILLSMNVYIFSKRAHKLEKKSVGGGILSVFFSVFAGIFGSGACIACVSVLFGFLGLPAITFLLAYRKEMFLVSILIVLISMYFASKAVKEHENCETCKIHLSKPAK